MKKIFAICAVALVAGAMLFTSCKKDNDDTTTDNNTTNTPTAGTTVTLNNNAWTATSFYADVTPAEEHDYITVQLYQDILDDDASVAAGFVGATNGSTYSCNPEVDNACYFSYYEKHSDLNDSWDAVSGTQKITDLDMNAKTISANTTETVSKGENEATLTIEMTNAEWTAATLGKRR
jgi:hypothetical protein